MRWEIVNYARHARIQYLARRQVQRNVIFARFVAASERLLMFLETSETGVAHERRETS